MIIIEPSYEILTDLSHPIDMLKHIEKIARVCYKSEDKITEDGESAKKLIKMLLTKNHEAMLEMCYISVKFITDRGVSHEIVRHRLANFAQESTRYCNYSSEKFGESITFVSPAHAVEMDPVAFKEWKKAMAYAEKRYFAMINAGVKAQIARDVLPNSTKTEICVTANFREWRHILDLRTAPAAHPQMRQIMVPLLKEFQEKIPIIFDDIKVEDNWEEIDKVLQSKV
jgi:thymidylate synthase (FAD)